VSYQILAKENMAGSGANLEGAGGGKLQPIPSTRWTRMREQGRGEEVLVIQLGVALGKKKHSEECSFRFRVWGKKRDREKVRIGRSRVSSHGLLPGPSPVFRRAGHVLE